MTAFARRVATLSIWRFCLAIVLHGFLGIPAGMVARAESTNAENTRLLVEIGKAMGGVNAVFTGFTQERHIALFKEPIRSEGYLCFQKPNRLRWETTQPYRSILVSDGAGVAQFEWLNEKWTKLDVGLAEAMRRIVEQMSAVMEGRYAGVQQDYRVSAATRDDGPRIILTPQQAAMRRMMCEIEIHLPPDLRGTRSVVLREVDGDKTTITFHAQTVGVVFPPGTFDLAQPAGLDVIRQAAASRPPK